MCTDLPPQQPADHGTQGQAAGGVVSRRTTLLATAGLAGSTIRIDR